MTHELDGCCAQHALARCPPARARRHEPTFKARLAERGLSDVVELVSKRGFNRETRAGRVRTTSIEPHQGSPPPRRQVPVEREAGILSDYCTTPRRPRPARGEEEHDGDDDLARRLAGLCRAPGS
ncbi:MAG: hypothetical protein U0514_02410 [Candidatus Andersenbacteria bacterium]